MTLAETFALFCIIAVFVLLGVVIAEYFEEEMPWDDDQ